MKCKILIDKPKDAKAKTFYALKNDVLHIYNQEHGDVYLVKNSKGETFSVRKENLLIL